MESRACQSSKIWNCWHYILETCIFFRGICDIVRDVDVQLYTLTKKRQGELSNWATENLVHEQLQSQAGSSIRQRGLPNLIKYRRRSKLVWKQFWSSSFFQFRLVYGTQLGVDRWEDSSSCGNYVCLKWIPMWIDAKFQYNTNYWRLRYMFTGLINKIVIYKWKAFYGLYIASTVSQTQDRIWNPVLVQI